MPCWRCLAPLMLPRLPTKPGITLSLAAKTMLASSTIPAPPPLISTRSQQPPSPALIVMACVLALNRVVAALGTGNCVLHAEMTRALSRSACRQMACQITAINLHRPHPPRKPLTSKSIGYRVLPQILQAAQQPNQPSTLSFAIIWLCQSKEIFLHRLAIPS